MGFARASSMVGLLWGGVTGDKKSLVPRASVVAACNTDWGLAYRKKTQAPKSEFLRCHKSLFAEQMVGKRFYHIFLGAR